MSRKASLGSRGQRTTLGVWIAGGVGLLAIILGLWTIRERPGGAEHGGSIGLSLGIEIHSLVIAQGAPSHIYFGGHDAAASSTDSSRTWVNVGTLDGADAMGWAFVGSEIWVGGHPGIEVSTDGGRTFTHADSGPPATDVHALGSVGDVVFAASPAAGLMVSTDRGSTWSIRSDRAGRNFMGQILVDPANADHVVAADIQEGVVESRDGGASWRVLDRVPGAMWVSWDPNVTDRIVVSGMGGAAITDDGGRTWSVLQVPSGTAVVSLAPGDGRTLYAGVADGYSDQVLVSGDGGGSWSSL